jgi:tricorn protease
MKKSTLFLIGFLFISAANIMGNNPLWTRYPSISPDGKTIVFTYMGDIYKVNSTGGTAQIITTNEAYDYSPVWSNDGKQIAFASDRHGNFDIFTISANGGSPKRITTNSANETPNCFTKDNKNIVFNATIMDDYKHFQYPKRNFSELYKVSVNGGRTHQILTTPAKMAKYNKENNKILYHDVKGTENAWRKHHTSSVTRDIWIYNTNTNKHKKLTTFDGEDRNPVFSNTETEYFYLSERSGSFNVWNASFNNSEKAVQLSFFNKNPVRFLSISGNGKLCYSYNGEIYTQNTNEKPEKVKINIFRDNTILNNEYLTLSKDASEMSASPNGKEVAFILRGEVYVTSSDYSTTKRITNTPQQERSVSYSPDGKTLIYASERNNSWNLYKTTRIRENENDFAHSSLLKEEIVIADSNETFQAKYSPSGDKIAYLNNRHTINVLDTKTGEKYTVLDGKYNFSYSDGDMNYNWSPDSKWLVASYIDKERWPNTDIALINANGKGEITNLTTSGYIDNEAKWMMNGKMIIWFTDRHGMRNQASWGSQSDVYALFLTQEAYNKFHMSKEEFEEYKELKKQLAEKKEEKKKKKKKKDKNEDKLVKPIKIELDGIQDRFTRLTINSARISDAVVTKDGEKLLYLCKFEKGYDLWSVSLRKKETKLIKKLKGYGWGMQFDKDSSNVFFVSKGKFIKYNIEKEKTENISYKAEFNLRYTKEKEYIFNHAWKQVKNKFYVKNLHGCDWEYYKKNYSRFLPHINNNYDFTEMLSEMLGELNASHTGSGYRHHSKNGDATAKLGVFFDKNYNANGLKIVEILDKSPLSEAGVKEGTIIEKIDDITITQNMDYFPLLNHKQGKRVLLTLSEPNKKKEKELIIKPISSSKQNKLLYQRWVEKCRAEVEKLSNGKLGYVHIKGMSDPSFRTIYSDLFGKHNNAEGVIIDTRFNGGGHMHEDIEVLFSGKKYLTQYNRGKKIGEQPRKRWKKPSIMLVGQSNYSNAHGTPWVYKTMGIGELVGMPVPGTMTSVWWETQIDKSIYFGLPQIGYRDTNGNYLENQQLEPDYKIAIDPEKIANNKDIQLEKAVDVLLNTVSDEK